MPNLMILITHHRPIQLKLQIRVLPKDTPYIAVCLKDETTLTKYSQSPSLESSSIGWESYEQFIDELEQIKTHHGFTQLTLCTDANLGHVGGDETSPLLKSMLQGFPSLTDVILHTQEKLCYDDAIAYMETYQQTRPSVSYAVCMHDDLLSLLKDPVTTRDVIPTVKQQTLLYSPESVTTIQVELPSVAMADSVDISPSRSPKKVRQSKPSFFSCDWSRKSETIHPERAGTP